MCYNYPMKRIYVSDVIHEQLKRESYQEGRTIQWIADEKLSRPLKEVTVPSAPSDSFVEVKSKADISLEIKQIEAERDAKLEFCQDLDLANEIRAKYQRIIDKII